MNIVPVDHNSVAAAKSTATATPLLQTSSDPFTLEAVLQLSTSVAGLSVDLVKNQEASEARQEEFMLNQQEFNKTMAEKQDLDKKKWEEQKQTNTEVRKALETTDENFENLKACVPGFCYTPCSGKKKSLKSGKVDS